MVAIGLNLIKYSKSGLILPNIKAVKLKYLFHFFSKGKTIAGCEK